MRQMKKTMQKNVIELHLPSIIGYEKVAMESVAAVARIMGFHQNRIEDLKTAVAEACINAMEHGNRFKTNTRVLVTLKMDKQCLEVNVKDQGKGLQQPLKTPHLEKQIEGKEDVRGWGIFLIKNLVDEVEFKKIPRGGCVTRMVIHLNR
ncbi:MAG: ATP-binding protein [Calditrichaeota bacterium]|nr:MAG: ATP-binding protein [Calditrichota bacterium]